MPTPPLAATLTATRPLAGVRAGSAAAWWGTRLAVIQDDAHAIALVDPHGTADPELWPLAGDGGALAKAQKPDYEAAFNDAAGQLWLVGSGSTPRRYGWARVAGRGDVEVVDATALYEALAVALGEAPNVEGVVACPDSLMLFHRAAGRGAGTGAIVEVPLAAAGPPVRVRAVRRLALGAIAGVALTFTDAARGPDGRLVFTAVAEDTPDAVADGAIMGAAIGVVDGERVAWAPLLDPEGKAVPHKVEGLVLDPDGRGGWVVTDPDDPERPALLGRVALAGFA